MKSSIALDDYEPSWLWAVKKAWTASWPRARIWTGTDSSRMLVTPSVLPYTSITAHMDMWTGSWDRCLPTWWLLTNSLKSPPGHRQKEILAPWHARLSFTGLAQYPSLAMRSGQAYLGGGHGLWCPGMLVTPSLNDPDQSPPHVTSTLYITPTLNDVWSIITNRWMNCRSTFTFENTTPLQKLSTSLEALRPLFSTEMLVPALVSSNIKISSSSTSFSFSSSSSSVSQLSDLLSINIEIELNHHHLAKLPVIF